MSNSAIHRGILVYNICLISMRNSVSDGATNKSVLNGTINSANEYEPDVLNTFCATRKFDKECTSFSHPEIL